MFFHFILGPLGIPLAADDRGKRSKYVRMHAKLNKVTWQIGWSCKEMDNKNDWFKRYIAFTELAYIMVIK